VPANQNSIATNRENGGAANESDRIGAQVIPPQPDDTPTRDERQPFHGTNPWSGPYFVLAVIGVTLALIAGILIAFLIGLARSS
jgi:hypothetical protein